LNYCVVCNRPTNTMHHLIFGRGKRPICDNDNIVIPLCDECHTMGRMRLHDNSVSEYLSKAYGQAIWERNQVANGYSLEDARDRFIKQYGKNWISEGL